MTGELCTSASVGFVLYKLRDRLAQEQAKRRALEEDLAAQKEREVEAEHAVGLVADLEHAAKWAEKDASEKG